MIQFKTLRWRNFLSYGNQFTEIDLSQPIKSLVVGENGAGKSTFIDALCFGLYNRAFRNINKPNLINSITAKNLLVEVEFDINNRSYLIRRGMKPNVFEIHKNGKLVDQTTGVGDYQSLLEKQILKINYKSFTQIVILGSANYTPFMRLPALSRREVIEDLLDIQVFSVMNSLLKEKINNNKADLLAIDYQIDLAQNKIDLNAKHLAEMRQNNEELIAAAQANIQASLSDLAANQIHLKVKESKVFTAKAELERINKRIATLDKFVALSEPLKAKARKVERDIKFYTDNCECPTCKQDITDFFKNNTLFLKNEELRTIEKAAAEIKAECDEYQSLTVARDKARTAHSEAESERLECQANIKASDRYIEAMLHEMTKLEARSQAIVTENDLGASLAAEYLKLEAVKEDLINRRELMATAGVLLKDGGIKTRIVRQYIPVMNKLINKMLAELDFFVQFEFNENFEEKLKSRFRDDFSYESFSEGEKVRINLAILFAWMAIAKLRNSASCSLLIMDEVLDGSLDVDGTDAFLKLLGGSVNDKSVFVISHKFAMSDKFNKVLEFKKTKNFSRLVT